MFTETLFKGSCVTIIYNKSKQFVFGEGPTDVNPYFPWINRKLASDSSHTDGITFYKL